MTTETKVQHTPGPWEVRDRAILSKDMNDYGNWIVAEMPRRDDDANTPQDYANLLLMAAAPTLLEALEGLIPWMCKALADNAFTNCVSPDTADRATTRARQAIALAKGRTG